MTRSPFKMAAGTLTLAAVVVALTISVSARASQGGERTVFVSVMDGTGATVPDMKQSEFVVKEDGAEREVTKIARANVPVSYAILLDTTGPAGPVILDIREAVQAFCELLLQVDPKTQISFTEFGGVAMTKREFTSSLPDLTTALGKIVPGRNAAPVMNEAFVEVAKQFGKLPVPSRKVIISINMEPVAESSTTRAPEVADEVQKSGATVWAVAVSANGKREPARDQLLKILTANSGGRSMLVQSSKLLPEVLRAFAINSFAQYAVTFKAGDKPAKMTDITVTRPQVMAMSMKWSATK